VGRREPVTDRMTTDVLAGTGPTGRRGARREILPDPRL
jgi:hypothetical protein